MGFTVKDVGNLIWKVLKFTMKTAYYCASKYPIISCILLFLFLLYVFLPSVFTFLIYFSPLVIFAGVVHKVFLEIDRRKKVKLSKEEDKTDAGISPRKLKYVENELAVDSNVSFSAGTTARRRNAKEGIKEDNAISTVEENDLVDKSTLVEENPKEIREVKVDSVIARVECSSSKLENGDDKSEEYQKFTNGKGEKETESPDDTEDDDEDEEEEREERNKAVEWTDDDQKNLMDLGLSEIERNKRLESLIARRRFRKYMSLQGRRTMGSDNFNAQIFSLQIPKTNPFLVDSYSNKEFSPVPGSAPSVLLPMSDPFDLPYDPFEERPDLSGDNFQQEFMVPNQKDMVFCRHESFHMNAFFPPDSKNEMHHDLFTKQEVFAPPLVRTPDAEQDGKRIQQEFPPVEASMVKADADSNQVKVEGGASEQVVDSVDQENEDDKSDVQTKEMVVDDASSDTNSSSSTEPIFRPNKEAILKSIRQLSRRNMVVDRESTSQTNNNESHDSGSSEFEKTKQEERFFHANMGMYHTPSHSIASDMQVEVSEVGSPPLTNISSQDEVSSTNDVDMEKEITSGSEETWGPSSHLCEVDENESRSREVHEVFPEKVVEQEIIDSHQLSPSKPELPEGIQHCKTNSNQSVHEKESSSPKNHDKELKTSVSVSDPEVPEKNDKEESRTEIDENKENLSILPNEINAISTESGAQVEKNLEYENSMDSSKPQKEEDISTTLKHLENEVHKLVQHKDVFKVSETNDNVEKPSQDREVESSLSEPDLSEVSSAASVSQNEVSPDQISTANIHNLDEQGSADGGANHSLGGHVASTVVVEQIRTEPSLSSPKSVLQPTFSNDQVSSPNVVEEIYNGVPQSASGIGETDSLQRDRAPAPADEVHLTDISRDVPSPEGGSIKLEDAVHPSVTTPEEVNKTSLGNEPDAEEDKSKGESHITSMLEATAELLRPGNDTDPKDTESMIEQIAETISPDPQSLPSDQSGNNPSSSTRQEEKSNPQPERLTDELIINPTAYDSEIDTGENGSKSESTTKLSSTHHHFSRSSEDFIEDLFSSLVGRSGNASANVTRQSSAREFSLSSEDFLQDLFKSLVSDGGAASTRVSTQGSMLESSGSTGEMIQDMFKSLQDNPRE